MEQPSAGRKPYPSDLREGEWAVLAPLVPAVEPGGRPARWSRREIVNAILYVVRGGNQWRAMPHDLPPWQTVYYPKKQIAIPKGTKFVVTGWFDNSAKNKYNPDPTKAVRFGEPTYDEMMIGWIDYTIDSQTLRPAAAMGNGSGTQK